MTLLRTCAAACVALLATLPAFAQKHTITHEDIWLMKRMSGPIASPDGRFVVQLITQPAYEDKDKSADLWLIATDGRSPARQLTSTPGAESDTTWNADGTRLAYSMRRVGSDAAQIYLLDLAQGGEARQITSLPTGARAPRFSPDGKQIAFVSDVPRGAKRLEDIERLVSERKARAYKARVYDSFPIRNWDHWLDDTVPHLLVQDVEDSQGRPGSPSNLLVGTKLAAASGFAGRSTDDDQELDAIWSPDGRSLVFVASANRNEAAFAFTDEQLYRVSVTGGEPQRLTSGNDSWSKPKFAPDGKTLYSLVERRTEKVYNATRLAALGWPKAGTSREIAASLDRSVDAFGISPDSREIFFIAEDGGLQKLYAVNAEPKSVARELPMTSGAYGTLAIPERAERSMIFATWESSVSPPELVTVDARSGERRALSSWNTARAASIDWLPVEAFSFDSQRGQRIHNFVVRPPNFDPAKKYPLFVVIHGGPHSMWRDQFVLRWNYHLLAAPGYVVLLTNYKGSTGFGEAFAQSIQGDPLAGPAEDVNDAADEATKRFAYIDASRQCAGGASYGGHLSNWLQGTTTRYRCLVSHAGLVNLESQWGTSDVIYSREVNMGGPVWEQAVVWREQNPIRKAAQFKTPVLVTVGERDFRVPLNNTLEYWSALQRQRVPSRLVVFPQENHWILNGENSRFFYGQIHDWLGQYLGADNAKPANVAGR